MKMVMDYDREHRRKRILAITEAMLTTMVMQGELDPDNDAALKKATKRAAADAKAAFDAAVEYLC